MVDRVAKGKLPVVAQQAEGCWPAGLPYLNNYRQMKALALGMTMIHLFDLDKILEANERTPALTRDALVPIKFSSQRRIGTCCRYQSWGTFHLWES